MKLPRVFLAAAAFVTCAAASSPARAEQRSWDFLTTGNGYGLEVYDAVQKKVTTFLEHPYRFLSPPSGDPTADGVVRRNLVYDVYFGVRAPSGHGWLTSSTSAAPPFYLDESNIVDAPGAIGSQQAESFFFAPFGYPGNALVGLLKAPGASDGYVLFNFHMGNGRPDPDASGESLRAIAAHHAVVETGPGGGAMVYVALSGADHTDCQSVFATVNAGGDLGDDAACSGDDVVPAFQKKLGADGWMAVAMQFVENAADADAAAAALDAWGNGRTPDRILADARAEFEAWRKPPSDKVALCNDDQRKLWRQSETVLRMAQVLEPNVPGRANHGMILATLPPGQWHVGWVRDGTYATVALARMGHVAEAKASLDFFLNAAPTGRFKSYVSNVDYKISVCRYYGNGEEEADYSGQSSPNVEIDGWGLAMWAARAYVEASGDASWLTTNYDAIRTGIAQALEANLEASGIAKADSSIWEVHDANKRHFAYTTEAAARGFCDFAALASAAGKSADASHYRQVASSARAGLFGSFVDASGALGGSVEALAGKHHDAATAEAFGFDLMAEPKGSAVAKATLDALLSLHVASGGYERNDDGLSSYDDDEWLFADLRISDALRRSGNATAADAIVDDVVGKAAVNFYLLPELFNAVPADGAIGKYAGSIPMVGYGAGIYVMTMLDRSGLGAPNDCGDGSGTTLDAFTCPGPASGGGSDAGAAATPDGGAAGGNGGAPADAPASANASSGGCACGVATGVGALDATALWIGLALVGGLAVRRRKGAVSRE